MLARFVGPPRASLRFGRATRSAVGRLVSLDVVVNDPGWGWTAITLGIIAASHRRASSAFRWPAPNRPRGARGSCFAGGEPAKLGYFRTTSQVLRSCPIAAHREAGSGPARPLDRAPPMLQAARAMVVW